MSFRVPFVMFGTFLVVSLLVDILIDTWSFWSVLKIVVLIVVLLLFIGGYLLIAYGPVVTPITEVG